MITPLINIEVEEDTDFNLELDYVDPSTGLPIDITSYSAELYIERAMGDNGSIITLLSSAGQIVIGGTSGVVSFTIPASATKGMGQFLGFYNLFLINPTGTVRTKLTKGFFTVSQSVG